MTSLNEARTYRGLQAVMKRMRADKIPAQESENWQIRKFYVNPMAALVASLVRYRHRPVPPGNYTSLNYKDGGRWHIMMSDTPAELSDALPFIRKAAGHVLVTGLGLGCVLRALSKKNDVQSVTVVELSQELADMVWPSFKGFKKIKLVVADARTWDPPRGVRFDSAWHDIWPTINDQNLPEMEALKKRYPTTVVTMCWSEELSKRMAYELEAVANGTLKESQIV